VQTKIQNPNKEKKKMTKIGIFPAAGGLGSSIINHIIKHVPASQLILIARKPDDLIELSRAGATVKRADYEDPSSLDRVFDGVDVLMLISYASFEIEYRVEVNTAPCPTSLCLCLIFDLSRLKRKLTIPGP
jgi:putative NADH-flavin reductase